MIEKIDEHQGGTHPKLRGQTDGYLTQIQFITKLDPFQKSPHFGVAACNGVLLVIAVEAVRRVLGL
jgi:hypothetical protein